MAEIKILKDAKIIGGSGDKTVYPVTTTQAVFSQRSDGTMPPEPRQQKLEDRLQEYERLLADKQDRLVAGKDIYLNGSVIDNEHAFFSNWEIEQVWNAIGES